MNKAARLANGDYILFMNAGDFFASDAALAEAMESLPDRCYAGLHHRPPSLSVRARRRAASRRRFRADLAAAQGGRDRRPLAGRRSLPSGDTHAPAPLADDGYDTSHRIVADHEFLYRQREKGASVHHSGALIAIYSSGGLSWTRRRETYDEWKAVLGRYGNADAAERIHAELREHSKARRSASRATAPSALAASSRNGSARSACAATWCW